MPMKNNNINVSRHFFPSQNVFETEPRLRSIFAITIMHCKDVLNEWFDSILCEKNDAFRKSFGIFITYLSAIYSFALVTLPLLQPALKTADTGLWTSIGIWETGIEWFEL